MDDISSLPLNSSKKPVPDELKVLQKYLKSEEKRSELFMELKEVIYATILFGIMSTGFFDKCLEMLPWTGSPLIKFGIKVLIFAVLLYVILLVSRRK